MLGLRVSVMLFYPVVWRKHAAFVCLYVYLLRGYSSGVLSYILKIEDGLYGILSELVWELIFFLTDSWGTSLIGLIGCRIYACGVTEKGPRR
jgi:hypothetical protein